MSTGESAIAVRLHAWLDGSANKYYESEMDV